MINLAAFLYSKYVVLQLDEGRGDRRHFAQQARSRGACGRTSHI